MEEQKEFQGNQQDWESASSGSGQERWRPEALSGSPRRREGKKKRKERARRSKKSPSTSKQSGIPRRNRATGGKTLLTHIGGERRAGTQPLIHRAVLFFKSIPDVKIL